jgi:hypothetical protein
LNYFAVELLPVLPDVEPVPDVAAGADPADSDVAPGLLAGELMVELEDEPVLGVVVLGVVVVLEEGLLFSFLPHADSAAAATIANISACFTMSVVSSVAVERKGSIDRLTGMQAGCRKQRGARAAGWQKAGKMAAFGSSLPA